MQLLAKDPNNGDDLLSMTQERAEVLDHNARLYFELDPAANGTNLYSFFCEYQDYLDDRNLIDVSNSPQILSFHQFFEYT